ncbi:MULTISPECIES: hypothetical protein [Novipirellula]|uniref:DUF4064 domain-containing protein n=1 Tax=Novipirellula rosea TaxID=1031540 RepID=A0ABP8NUA8_9BACT
MSDDPNPFARPSGESNPYTPSSSAASIGGAGAVRLSEVHSRGMVGQIPILGVLMIVQGVFITLMGLVFGGYAFAMPMIFRSIREDAAKQGANPPPMPQEMELGMLIGLGVAAVCVLAIAVFTIWAGVRVIKFQSRTFAIVMLCVGMLMCLTCYCAPTQIALSIYGLIVLLNGPVTDAFRFAEKGHSAREIQQAFLSLP